MVRKNLTISLLEEGGPQVQYYNSLGNKGVNFFTSIDVSPKMQYTDAQGNNCSINSESGAGAKMVHQLPSPRGRDRFYQLYGQEGAQVLYDNSQDATIKDSIFQYSLGLEKNPWSWVYSAVTAEAVTRPLFFPIGDPLVIKARAFAKPFGGRIGPWHTETWRSQDQMSSGDKKVDEMVPARVDENGNEASNQEQRRDTSAYPNHSRYPGDQYGLRSNLGLNSIRTFNRATINGFAHFNAFLTMGGENHDSLPDKSRFEAMRNAEIAAIAPDVFDATYYSIEPEFSKVYKQKLVESREQLFVGGGYVENVSDIKILGDLGSEPGEDLDVFEQIQISRQSRNQATFYYLNEPKHLLTGWLHGFRALDFSESNMKPGFANCDSDASSSNYGEDVNIERRIPGGCLKDGGRTGYSVKLFSSKIFREDLNLGGNGASPGKITNGPPPYIWN